MKQDVNGAKHFHEVLAATPKDLRQQMEWSFHIADEIDDALKAKGMTQKELAQRLGTSAAAVSRWLGGATILRYPPWQGFPSCWMCH